MNIHNLGVKLKALFLAVVLVFTLGINAFAVSKSYTLSNSLKPVTVTTGSGLQYFLGTKTTTVRVINSGRTPVQVYLQTKDGDVWKGQVSAGYFRTWTLKGSNSKYTLKIQGNAIGSKATVSTDVGSVS